MRKILFMTALFAFVFTSSVWAADISGNWTVNMKNPEGGDETFDLNIKVNGGKLTLVGSNHPKISELSGTGTLKGDVISMDIKGTGVENEAVEFFFDGKVSGNKMSGTETITVDRSNSPSHSAPPSGSGSGALGGESGGAPGGAPGAGGSMSGGPPGGGGAPGGTMGGGSSSQASQVWSAEKK